MEFSPGNLFSGNEVCLRHEDVTGSMRPLVDQHLLRSFGISACLRNSLITNSVVIGLGTLTCVEHGPEAVEFATAYHNVAPCGDLTCTELQETLALYMLPAITLNAMQSEPHTKFTEGLRAKYHTVAAAQAFLISFGFRPLTLPGPPPSSPVVDLNTGGSLHGEIDGIVRCRSVVLAGDQWEHVEIEIPAEDVEMICVGLAGGSGQVYGDSHPVIITSPYRLSVSTDSGTAVHVSASACGISASSVRGCSGGAVITRSTKKAALIIIGSSVPAWHTPNFIKAGREDYQYLRQRFLNGRINFAEELPNLQAPKQIGLPGLTAQNYFLGDTGPFQQLPVLISTLNRAEKTHINFEIHWKEYWKSVLRFDTGEREYNIGVPLVAPAVE
eukprot:TRINITY_DN6682_c0_g1_i12.p2 TRINITY_DN6682_c0_g1~~TRINITY_DN6682_c0_g1_i12.p2  ORF type:complete len:397 (+),score=42.88 TRINITY_DN6682_c0_g1_i12:37-1191(+)